MTTQNEPNSRINEAIDAVLSEMAGFSSYDDEYAKMVEQLDKLHQIKSYNKDTNRVSKDALVAAVANILGIGMILGYEKAHVVTSKALSFVLKTRV